METATIENKNVLLIKTESDFRLRKEFLKKRLKSVNGQYKYKRYKETILRYAGGKSLAVGFIAELLPDKLDRIISPFLGGGSFEIACVKELEIEVIGFDIFDVLVNFWQVQIEKTDKLAKKLLEFSPTKEEFKKVKETLKLHWKKIKRIDDKVDLAAHYFFNHNTSYGPGFLSWPSSVYMNEKRYFAMIERLKKTKLKKMSVHCDSFENVFPKFKNDFFYCDPPYYLNGDSKMFKGIYPQRNFPIHHNNFPHEKLRDALYNHPGNFILSYNDCSTIREWYKNFEIIEVSWQYTMGQGETRIGENRKNGNLSNVKKSHEILIVKLY